MDEFLKEVAEYAADLEDFKDFHDLPDEWFVEPDHVAVKGEDAAGFDTLVEQFRGASEQISCIDMDGRRLATAKLITPIVVGSLGEVSWVEIMEPRPEKVGQDVVGFEHMEFTFPDFDSVCNYLDGLLAEDSERLYSLQKNPGHSWVNIVLNPQGQELKINNRALGEVVQTEIKEGKSYLL